MPVPPVPDGRPARASWVETLFTDDLMRAVAASGGGALVYVALRRLRKLRVALGYAELARVVAVVRGRLWDGTRPIDLVQDLGDGRFVVVVPRVGDMGALEPSLRTLLGALKEDIDGAGRPVHPSFRVGVTFFPTHGVDLLDLLRQAELAALSARPDRPAEFIPDQSDAVQEELGLAEDLRAAIDADALSVVYQPFIDARTQTLRGAEALVRWEHPRHGPISPARFVPIAEEAGFVRRITDFVMRTAARAVAESLGALPAGFYVSVNLSGQEILEPDRAEQVLAMVRAAGLPLERLQVEITEGVLMRERRRAVQMLQRLRDAGVGVATDDFGTGYSSLAYLAELPIQVLKIDRLFVRDLPAPSAVQLLQSISALGHSLGLTVLVEGVENDPQLEACLACGVDVIQGYYFGRPRSFASLLAWTDPPAPSPPAAQPGPIKDLPLLPTTVAALWSRAVGQTGPGLVALARSDAGLAGELLRLAAERGEVGVGPTPDLASIVRTLGADTLLAALESRRAATLSLPPHGVVGGVWDHARLVARWAEVLGSRLGAGRGLYTLGLLHDVGRLVLLDDPRAGIAEIEARGWNTPEELEELEAAVLHCHHAQVGGLFARRWHFPPELVAAIEHHHRRDALAELPAAVRLRVQVVRAADHLAAMMAHPSTDTDDRGRRGDALVRALFDDPVRALGPAVLSACWDEVAATEET